MNNNNSFNIRDKQSGRIGYLILYFLGAPVGLLILLWVILGNNIFGAGWEFDSCYLSNSNSLTNQA